METAPSKTRVNWYRSPVPRDQLSKLNQRSDFKALLQTGGYLGLIALTATATIYGFYHWPWYAWVPILFFHGMCSSFWINGFHELVHDSVFKTRWLNSVFLRIFSFLGWLNHHQFWASHMEHHKFTLHPPDDLEVTLPMPFTLRQFVSRAIVNPLGVYYTLKNGTRYSLGRLKGQWEHQLFDGNPTARNLMFRWARLTFLGHGLIIAVCLYMHWWIAPIVICFSPFYGGFLFYLCNNTQHAGLQDNVPDFRLCCRTIILDPFTSFLYWKMNYHTEHHMYAAVPCYNLAKLHKAIEADLPYCPRGLIATWKQVLMIQKRQKTEPGWLYNPDLPTKGRAAVEPVASSPQPAA